MTYQLASSTEAGRQLIQDEAWRPETEALLSRIGVQPGWRCLDLGCGAGGMLDLLAEQVGPDGEVIGVEQDRRLLAAAGQRVESFGLKNVSLIQASLPGLELPPASFDLVHCRFLLAHIPDPEAVLAEMVELARPGGTVLVQEPDHDTLDYLPASPAWRLLKQALLALVRRHSDPNLGRRALELLHGASLHDLELRTAILQLSGGHPYMSMPVMAVRGAKDRLVEAGLISATELDTLLEEVEELVASPETIHVSVLNYQVWGKTPPA